MKVHMDSPSVTIYLDTVKKQGRSKSEWRDVNRAYTTYEGQFLSRTGDGWVLMNLLKDMFDLNPANNPQVHVLRMLTRKEEEGKKCEGSYRGVVTSGRDAPKEDFHPCFVPQSLYSWLGLDEGGNKIDNRPENFKVDNTPKEKDDEIRDCEGVLYMSNWQPIETAPVNTLVDVWIKAKRKGESGRRTNMQLLDNGEWWGSHNIYNTDKITHWMPVPEPPK